jgi:hypothetical protein
MGMPRGADLLVAALENERVDRIFGIPGEENLDVVESLRNSKIELIITRHETTGHGKRSLSHACAAFIPTPANIPKLTITPR